MRITVAAAVACLIGGMAVAGDAKASIRKLTNIPAQNLGQALQTLAEDREVQIVYFSAVINRVNTRGAVGELTTDEAFSRLLAGTGLTYRFLDDKTITIVPLPSGKSGADPAPDTNDAAAVPETTTQDKGGEKASFWSRFRMAQVDSGAMVGGQAAAESGENRERSQLEEIVVTAQKRAERIQEVPLSITALTSEDIDRRGLVSSSDYLRGIPGVNQITQKLGESITIRGIETTPEQQNFSSGTTVATYFGETPTTNTAGVGGGTNVDIKLVDIARVEVLRGPQGTAFGNSSLGGAVRTIPVEPKTDRFEGKVAAGYSATSGNGGSNTMVQAVANIPLIEDKLAIRAVGYQFEDDGFYRNIAGSDAGFLTSATSYGAQSFATNQRRVGDSEFVGGRISALLQASEDLKFTLSFLTQDTKADSSTHSGGQTNGGAFDQAMLEVAPEDAAHGKVHGFYDANIDLANATMDYNLGWANLVATFSHIESGSDHAQPIFVSAVPWSSRAQSDHSENSGEIRLSTQLEGPVNFLAGVYAEKLEDDYTEDSFWYGTPESETAFLGVTGRDVYLLREQRELEQKAVFGEASWHFAPGWTLTGGLRYYDYDRTGQYNLTGLFGEQLIPTNGSASGTSFKGNLSYKFNDNNAMLYASYAEGFRLGKPQPGLTAGACDRNGDGILDGTTNVTLASTRAFESDEAKSFELGGKFSLFERRLQLAADVFHIDWTGVPFRVLAPPASAGGCGLAFNSNAGGARSQGVELEANIFASESLRIDFGGSYVDAELSKDAPFLPTPAFDGDRLPSSPKVSTNLGFQYEFKLGGYPAFVRADSVYVGSFYGNLQTTEDTRAGDYVKVDASARVVIRSLSVDLFVRNLTNADEYTYRGVGGEGNFFGYRLMPRTVGVQIGYSF